jgi:iron complex outermembrane recepter protein
MHYASRCCWSIIFGLLTFQAYSEEKISFEIPAGKLSRNILRFYDDTGIHVLYAVTFNVENVHTQEVHGRYTPKEALALLLHDTGFYYEFQNEKSVLIKPLPGYFVPDKDAARPPPPPIRQTIPLPGSDIVMPPLASTKTDPALEEVTITGSMLRGVFEIMSPTQRIEKESFVNAPFASVSDIMQTVPQTASGGLKDYYYGDFQERNNAYGTSISLRGLGTGSTLVLVDGFRQPSSGGSGAFVDVSNIPVSIIERIEVVPDGASALYGSDAIAGVVNIITRDAIEGPEMHMRWGAASGDVNEKLFSQLWGGRSADSQWLLAYEYSERSALQSADRSYAADADKRSLGGSDFRSYLSSPGNILDPATLLPAYAIPRDSANTELRVDDLLSGQVNLFNGRQRVDLTPERDMHSAFFRSFKELNDQIRVFGQARYSTRQASFASFAYEDILAVPSSNPFFIDPFGDSPEVLMGYSFANDFAQPVIATKVNSFTTSVGMQLKFASDWRAVVSTSLGRERLGFALSNWVDPYKLSLALSDTDPDTAFNPFSNGTYLQNPDTLTNIQKQISNDVESRLLATQLVLDGVALHLPTGPVRLAFGMERRYETLAFASSEATPESYKRDISATFTEVTVPLVGQASDDMMPPLVELSLAARFENYGDFGDTFNPRFGVRWVPAHSFKLRTSWGSSFKAPNLLDLYQEQSSSSGFVVLRDPKSVTRNSLALVREGNNPQLDEETSATWTVGLDVSPVKLPGSTFSLTYYSMRHRNQVVRPGPSNPYDILILEPDWQMIVNRQPTAEQLQEVCNVPNFFGSRQECLDGSAAALVDLRLRNLASTYTSGIDFEAQHQFSSNFGWFEVGLSGLRILSFERKLYDNAQSIDLLDTAYNPLSNRWRATAQWAQAANATLGFHSKLTYKYVTGYKNDDLTTVGSYSNIDWQIGYRTPSSDSLNTAGMSIKLNIVNVLNKKPPFFNGPLGYDSYNTDPYGRAISCSVVKEW